MSDATYQPKVYHERDGDREVFADGGYLQAVDTDFTAAQLKAYLRRVNNAVIATSGGIFSTKPVPSGYGLVILSMSTGITASLAMFSGMVGDQIRIMLRTGSTGTATIVFSANASGLSGVTCIGLNSAVDLSSIDLQASANIHPQVLLECLAANVWSIVDKSSVDVTEQPAA